MALVNDARACSTSGMTLFRLLQVVALWTALVLTSQGRTFTVLVYNVENLFDADGIAVYDDYQPSLYTPAHLKTKVTNVARVVATMENGRGPDIILFQEIEIDRTPDRVPPAEEVLLKAFEEKGLKGYTVIAGNDSPTVRHEDGNERAVKCVVFTRFPVKSVRNHPTQTARNILEVELDVDGNRLFVFNNHWKSGASDPVTEKIRIANARTLRTRIDQILRGDPSADIIIGGDLNSQYNQGVRYRSTMPETALNHVLRSQGNERALERGDADLYNLWFELPPAERGSDVFRGEWGTLMQLILSRGLYDSRGVQYIDNSFAVLRIPGLNMTSEGLPLRWSNEGPAGSGFADHFPIYARFRTVTEGRTDRWMALVRPSESDQSPLHPPKAPEKVIDLSQAVEVSNLTDLAVLRDGSMNGKVVRVEGIVGEGNRISVAVKGILWEVWIPEPNLRTKVRTAWKQGDRVSFYGIVGQFKGQWQFTVQREEWLK